MKAIVINEYGGPENLEYTDQPDPIPGKGEVLIKIAYASVNPVDWKIREGRLQILSGNKYPLYMGTELSGVVMVRGESANRFKVGDRVFAGLSHKGGAYSELVAVNERKVSKIPDALGLKEASTLAVAGVTPLQAFTLHYKVKPGDSVLVNGGSGGVGSYAIQIAKVLGAKVTAVCSERNIELVKKLGADEVIDYNSEDFRLRENSYDVILDAAANAFFPEARKCLKRGGMLVKLNMLWSSVFQSIWTGLFASRKLKMILVKDRPADLQWMMDKIISGEIKVLMDREFSLSEAREAQEYSASGRARGKIVLKVAAI